jgi:ABC-type phosphate transport system substrate-binding protein
MQTRRSHVRPVLSKVVIACILFLLNAAHTAEGHTNSSSNPIVGCGATFADRFWRDVTAMYSVAEPNSSLSFHSAFPSPLTEPSLSCSFTAEDDLLLVQGSSNQTGRPEVLPSTSRVFPVVAGATVPIYNVPELHDCPLVVDLNLLALIYLGQVTKWNDARISALNPQVSRQLPNKTILVGSRAEPSRTTFAFTAALASGTLSVFVTNRVESTQWRARVGVGSVVNWPVRPRGSCGPSGVSLAGVECNGVMGTSSTMTSIVKMTNYSIAYVNLADAVSFHNTIALMRNRAGRVVRPNAASISLALLDVIEDMSPDV